MTRILFVFNGSIIGESKGAILPNIPLPGELVTIGSVQLIVHHREWSYASSSHSDFAVVVTVYLEVEA